MRRVNDGFVALALKATLVNGVMRTDDAEEAELYARLKRCMLAPQGIGVLNGSGQVLAWVQMFDDQKQIAAFLDHAVALKPGITERYMSFPRNRMDDRDVDPPAAPAESHAKGARCPARAAAKGATAKGGVTARLYGRALDAHGKPVADTVRQEHYVQDQFSISRELQAAIAMSLEIGRLPEDFGRLVATHAHLGHMDVRPLMEPNVGKLERADFKATKSGDAWRLDGTTEVASKQRINGSGEHIVKLTWTGFATFDGGRMTRLVLHARGTERLLFENGSRGPEAARLPGGRGIDQEGGVRYGIVGEPVSDENAVEGAGESIQEKMKRLGPAIERRRNAGRDMQPVGRLLEKFEPHMKEGRFKEAEAILDEALKLLDEEGSKVEKVESKVKWLGSLDAAKRDGRPVMYFLMLGDLDDPSC